MENVENQGGMAASFPPRVVLGFEVTKPSEKVCLGVKVVKLEPITLGEYNTYRGWSIPENEDPTREGYLVTYEDGYISWSPKEVADAAYRAVEGLTFGLAIEALKQGKLVARIGWNGKGMFIFMRPSDEITPKVIVDNVKSLPQSVKNFIAKKYGNETHFVSGDEIKVRFTEYLCMYAADGTIVNGWLASQTDMLAEDWIIVG